MAMVRIILIVCSLIVLLGTAVHAKDSDVETLTLTIPESVLAEAVRKSLPFLLDAGSDTVEGSIWIQSIENLQLDDQQISGIVTMLGNDILISTSIAGQQLRLKVGTVKLTFNLAADSRFEDASQTLFIRPTVTDLKTEEAQAGDELGVLLIGLFNGREFPLAIDKLQPIIADTGEKKLAIGMRIKDITIARKMLSLHLLPDIRTLK